MRLPTPLAALHIGLTVLALGLTGPISAQERGGITPQAGQCGTPGNPPCLPGIQLQSHTFIASVRAPESGPFTYTITVRNDGQASGTVEVLCVAQAQLPCVQPSPATFSLNVSQTRVVTVGYSTVGLGQFGQRHIFTISKNGDVVDDTDSLTVGPITVNGVAILTHWNPLDSAELQTYDTLKVLAQHSSGISTATLKLFIDGQDSTSQTTVTTSGITATNATLTMSGGFHTMRSYGCSVSGRCDSTSATTFFVPGNPAVNLDDSLGTPAGEGIVGLLPGALPLPPDSLKGCPLYEGHPMIKLSQPFSYIDQFSTPVGMLFRANVNFDTTITISTVNYDYPPSDPTDCGSFTYLTPSQYDWNYWADPSPTDSIWDVYPYADFTPPGGGIGPMSVGGGGPGSGGTGSGRGGGGGQGGQGGSGGGPPGGVVIQSLPAGAMNPDSVRAWLNGTLIINNGQPVAGKGVTLVSQNPAQYQYKMSVAIGVAQGLLHRYNVSNPPSDNGGWNELILAAADSTGHWTKVRSRFVQLQSNSAGALTVTPLRDFRHQAQADCAAFGALQCAGVTLVQAIPGFVTRDKDRSLHLVYRSASQRAKTILPYDLYVSRILRAPDSVKIVLREGVVVVSDTLRYYGTKKPGGVLDADVLWENANERRVLGAALFAPATGTNAAIRTITAQLRSFYGSSPTFQDDTVRQEVTQLHLSDTTMSRLGPGWALAEQSRLITLNSATRRIWLSGDGSYVVFTKVGSVWVAPPGETARLKDTTIASATQVIFLDNGARIGYNATGWQLWTSDVIGNLTQFKYNATTQRLDSIVDPTGIRYEFVYFSSGSSKGQVSEVWIRGTGGATQKMASFTYDGSARLTVMKVWRTATTFDSTVYAYHATAPGAFVTSVTDPRSTTGAPIVTTFSYETLYWTPLSILRPPDRFGAATAEYRDPFRRAVPRAGRGTTQATAERLIYRNWYKGTWLDFTKRATDFTVDRFGGPTLVTAYAPPGFMTEDFLVIDWGGNDVRRIERDSMGRVMKIVHGDPAHLMLDSVMYRYDVLGPVDTIIRNTLAYPATVTLDTTVFTFDTARVTSTAGRCTRLLTMRDAMAGLTRTIYGTSGAGVCLPIKAIGLALDTTIFTYSSLAVGDAAAARPVSVRDPVGIISTMQYHGSTWNSATGIRVAANDTSRAWYNPYGWADSLKNGVGTRTYYQYDQSGRVLRAKTGTGALAPTTATFYNRSGLTDSVRVYPSSDADLATPTGTVQTTKYRYNRLGWVDSTIYPGGRRQHFLRDRNGNPVYDFPGNGSFTGRLYDWQGRISLDNPSAVGPIYSVNGDSFATRVADSVYRSLGLTFNVTLSSGQAHQYSYDNKARVTEIRTRDVGQGLTDLLLRQYEYTPSGQVTRDSLLFVKDGLAVTRRYQYNRRGQRTMAATTVSVTTGTIAERNDSLRYLYDSVTARLDSLRARVNVSGSTWDHYAGVRWLYDRAGRDTLQRVTPVGSPVRVQVTRTTYDAAGRVSLMNTSVSGGPQPGTWYQFTSPSYSKIDELVSFTATEPSSSGGPANALTGSSAYTYATNGTGRVSYASLRSGTPRATTHSYTFDVLGNEVQEVLSAAAGGCAGNGVEPSVYGSDNALLRTVNACNDSQRYWNDKAGNRLVQLDTSSGGVYQGVQSLMSYTARNQLFFSMSPTAQVGTYDYNWHWYDAAGRRVLSQRQQGGSWVPSIIPTGQRTFYVYDGNDVALMVVKSGTTWWVKARYVTGGLDNALAGRFSNDAGNAQQNLALVNDRQGTTLAAMRADGNQETSAAYFSRDPYGRLQGATGTGGTINPETGYAGASSPNASGGFTYLRNRWYDPKTGRFLTQDPIGLAGGVNLYSYAGNNPVAYTDPFGLQTCRGSRWYCQAKAIAHRWQAEVAKIGAAVAHFVGEVSGANSAVRGTTGRDEAGNRLSTGARVGEVALAASGLIPGDEAFSLGARIARGHAWTSHADDWAALGLRTGNELAGFIDNIVATASPENVRSLTRGRTAYWDEVTETVVIHNPLDPDAGTAFRPADGRAYFDKILK